MGLINIPEFTIYNAIRILLDFIKSDYTDTVNKNDTLLYQLVSDLGIGSYDFLTQAKSIFVDEVDNPRAININLAYNMNLESPPSIFIDMPSETSGQQNIGEDEGYQDTFFVSDNSSFQPVYTRRYQATYRLTITSDNSTEVVLIYHVLKSLFTSLYFHFNQLGLQNIVLGGGDLQISNLPGNIFYRVITINTTYESSAIGLHKYPILNKLIIQSGKPVTEL